MKSLVAATIITLLVAGTQVWAQLNHEYVPSAEDIEDQHYNPLSGERYPSEVTPASTMDVVQEFMDGAGFSDKWWILERVQDDPEGLVAFIMIEGKHRYALFIIDEHIVGIQKLKIDDSDEECSSP